MKPHELYLKSIKKTLTQYTDPSILSNVLNTDTKKIINKKIEQILKNPKEKHKKEKILKILSKLQDPYAQEIFKELNKKWGLEIQFQELSQDFDNELLKNKQKNKLRNKTRPRLKLKKITNKILLGSEIALIASILLMFLSLIFETTIGVFTSWILITISSIILVSRLNIKK